MRPTVNHLKIFFIIGILGLFSCSRAVDDKAELVIKLPGEPLNSSSKINQSNFVNNLVASNLITDAQLSSGEWNPVQVTSLGQLNCFFVIAGGPDMEKFSCAKNNNVIEIVDQTHYFSEMAGPAVLGSELKMYVLSGKSRVFKLFGMYAATESECKLLSDPTFAKTGLSKPYLIGQSEPTEILVDKPNTVKIAPNATFDPRSFVDYCTIGNLAGSATQIAESYAVELKIKAGSFGQNYFRDQCVPVTASIIDTNGHIKASDIKDTFKLMHGLPVKVDSTLYPSLYDCAKGSNGSTSIGFETYGLLESKTQWAKFNGSSGFGEFFTLFGSITSGTEIAVNGGGKTLKTIMPRSSDHLQLTSAAQPSVMALFPERIQNEVCTPIRITRAPLNYTPGSPSDRLLTNDEIKIQYKRTISGSQQIDFYSDSSCATSQGVGGLGVFLVTGSELAFNAYIKIKGFSNSDRLYFYVLHSRSATAMTNAHFVTTVGESSDLNFNRFVIQGPGLQESATVNAFLDPVGTGQCLGPFRVYPVNKTGSFVKLDTAYQFAIRINEKTGDEIYAAPSGSPVQTSGTFSPCSLSANLNPTSAFIGGTYPSVFEFYVKPTSYLDSSSNYVQYRQIYLVPIGTSFNAEYLKINLVDPNSNTNSGDTRFRTSYDTQLE